MLYIMSAKILTGTNIRDERVAILATKFADLDFLPILTIIQVGNRSDSTSYIKAKANFAKKIGVEVRLIILNENICTDEVIEIIKKENENILVKGIIVQLPLPAQLDKFTILESIDPKKDVDALTSESRKKWEADEGEVILPATARGVKTLLKYYGIPLKNKNVVVIGRSDLVGRPIAIMCQNQGAKVEVCHRGTVDIKKNVIDSDIVIVATGNANLIKKEMVKSGQIIIDVGINAIFEDVEGKTSRKIVGDVDFENVKEIVEGISPVPGGVGPLTVLSIFENLYDLIEMK